ncbi:MAG: NAD(P)-binding protein [Candidatus Puniceispirillales bacterium]
MNTNNKNFKTNNKYQVLFEPIKIGPVVAKNRFYQVPHCNGGGYRDPSAAAEMRNIKSEGGWGVVFTEQVEMHHTSEITPYIELRLWDDRDIKIVSKMADKIHNYDTLAGIELTYPGINGPNLYTKEVPMAATAGPILTFTNDPVNAREMDKEDIRNLRKWFRKAARRSKIAGFDIICLYGAHGFGAIQHFLSRSTNHRIDEYGGSLENRSRLMKELTEEVMDEVGDTMAVSIRLSLQELGDKYSLTNNEIRDCIEMHSSLPDLWDLAQGAWEDCSGTSRFVEEGAQQDLIQGIKSLTNKPVVGVGRFTSPDLMVKQIKSGNLDFIGAARPSIADPFLPNKIRDGKIDEIRECIGCNICVTGDMTMSISRCTQNPSFMEEWRKGWHPENFQIKGESKSILVIGSGPAGLEATRCLSKRGYDVTLAEKNPFIGGRVTKERLLPGLSAWGRVVDYREGQINKLKNVNIYLESEITKKDILEFDFEHICFATGSIWKRDGVGRVNLHPLEIDSSMNVYTPDDVMGDIKIDGKVVIFDDDHYYMGSVLAEKLVKEGNEVIFVTPASIVSEWSLNTLDQPFIQKRLIELGVQIICNKSISKVESDRVDLLCKYTGNISTLETKNILFVTSRQPIDGLYKSFSEDEIRMHKDIKSIDIIGDANAPAPIAWATYAGYNYAFNLDKKVDEDSLPFKREITDIIN